MEPIPEISVFRPDRTGIRKVLGDLEAEVMEVIWARPTGQGTTVREVFAVLGDQRPIAYTTVMNTMTRLAKKRLLRAETAEHAYVYHPNFSQTEFITRFVGRILEDLLVSFAGPTLAQIEAMADPQHADRVQALLDEISRRRSEGET